MVRLFRVVWNDSYGLWNKFCGWWNELYGSWRKFCVEAKSNDEEFSNEKLGGEGGQFCIDELKVCSNDDGS